MKRHERMAQDGLRASRVGSGQGQAMPRPITEGGTSRVSCQRPGHRETGMKATIVARE
jgi:hypothetical protein